MNTKEILQGIKDWAAPKVIYDISAAHNNTKYTDLSAALGTNGDNIPQEYRKGGVTVRYVQSSDNKYVQYMLNAQNWTTNISCWEKINLEKEIQAINTDIEVSNVQHIYPEYVEDLAVKNSNLVKTDDTKKTYYVYGRSGDSIIIRFSDTTSSVSFYFGFADNIPQVDLPITNYTTSAASEELRVRTFPRDCYLLISCDKSNSCYYNVEKASGIGLDVYNLKNAVTNIGNNITAINGDISDINQVLSGGTSEKSQSISPTFSQGACFADTNHSNFGGVNSGITDCKVTGRLSLADYLGRDNLKIRLTFPKTNNSNYLKYGAVFYSGDGNSYVIQDGATCFASAGSNGIETVEISVPTTAKYFRTTFWSADTYGSFTMNFVWTEASEGLENRVETLEQEVEGIGAISNIYWAACGDSITNANHDGIDSIPNDDPFIPIDGYSDVDYKRKCYAYYVAKKEKIKWANYGWGGTTLGMFNSKAYPNVHPFVGDRIENMKVGIDWNYISILFGWNDLTFGVIYQRDKWLQETYSEDIGYPVLPEQIGTTGFATQAQKDACDAATGTVGGIQYNNNEDYFVARMIGTISDTGKDTYMGAYNYALEYLMKKYQKSKILVCVPFVPNHGTMFYNAVVAIAEKWGVPYFDFEDMKYWYRLRVTNTTTLMNPDREDGKWVNYKGYLCPANVAGYNRARFSSDDTHPSNLGYQVMASPFGDKLFNG